MTRRKKTADKSEGLAAADTLKGDIRDRLIGLFKDEAKKPWPELNEREQTRVAARCEDIAERLIYRTIQIVHAEGAPSIRMVVGKVAFGKGVSTNFTASKSEENRHLLADLADGAEVVVVMENVHRYLGENGPAAIEPDQRQMDVSPKDEKPAGRPATKKRTVKKAAAKKKTPAKKKAAAKKVDPNAIFNKKDGDAMASS